jgi:glutathione S-transferase
MLLEEAGAPHEFVIPTRAPQAGPAGFVAASPHGRVPALVDHETGLTLTESAAVCMYIADRFPDAGLAPRVGTCERAIWGQWLVYLSNTVQTTLYQFIYPERYISEPAHAQQVRAAAQSTLSDIWDWIDGQLADRRFLVADQFSAADAYLWMLGRWSRRHADPAFSRPYTRLFWDRVLERPALRRVIDQEQLSPVPE